jgi:transposase
VSSRSEHEEARSHAGLDLSRRRRRAGGQTAIPSDVDGLRSLAAGLRGERVRAVIESMTGARFVHDTLEEHGWEVLVAAAQKVKGLPPLAWQERQDGRAGAGRAVVA